MIKLSCKPFEEEEKEYNLNERRIMLLAFLQKSNELYNHILHNGVCIEHFTDNLFKISIDVIIESKRLSLKTKAFLINFFLDDFVVLIATNIDHLKAGVPINILASKINVAHETALINEKTKQTPNFNFKDN